MVWYNPTVRAFKQLIKWISMSEEKERHTDSQTVGNNNNNNNNTAMNIEIQGIAITHIIHSFIRSFNDLEHATISYRSVVAVR